jgi:hypothetical protein
MNLIYEDWLLNEQDIPPISGQPDMPAGGGTGALGTGPGGFPQAGPAGTDPNQQPPDPNVTQQLPKQPDDVSQDPQAPDMPEEDKDKDLDFEQWKNKYFKQSVVGDPNEMLDLLKQVRERSLEPYERKFVEDNIQIQYLRQNANIKQASDKLAKLIKDELDKNNPSVNLVNHLEEVLKTMPELVNVFIKITGLLGSKGDAHRKYIASLLNAVQVGSGASTEDIVLNGREYSIGISTRFNSQLGDVSICKWELKEDDPEKFLKEPELRRLESGSPEEKDALRKRIIIESIADKLKTRSFIINVVDTDGTAIFLGWDLANSIRSAFKDGKLVVKLTKSDNSEALIEDNGAIVAFMDVKIAYRKPTGKLDAEGNKDYEELPFMDRREGYLFLTATASLLSEAATTLQGLVYKLIGYNGNPSDLKALSRSSPKITEILLRNP